MFVGLTDRLPLWRSGLLLDVFTLDTVSGSSLHSTHPVDLADSSAAGCEAGSHVRKFGQAVNLVDDELWTA